MPDTGVALTLGGASLVFGIKPVLGAAAVGGFLVGDLLTCTIFWRVQDPEKRQSEMINFTKNRLCSEAHSPSWELEMQRRENCL